MLANLKERDDNKFAVEARRGSNPLTFRKIPLFVGGVTVILGSDQTAASSDSLHTRPEGMVYVESSDGRLRFSTGVASAASLLSSLMHPFYPSSPGCPSSSWVFTSLFLSCLCISKVLFSYSSLVSLSYSVCPSFHPALLIVTLIFFF